MALPRALTVLSLLPLLDTQDPACALLKATPITNATLERQLEDRSQSTPPPWSQSSHPWNGENWPESLPESCPWMTEDEALSITLVCLTLRCHFASDSSWGQCIYNFSHGEIQRENRTFSSTEKNYKHNAYLWLTKDPETFILYFFPEDEPNRGMVFHTRKEVTKEQLKEFHEALKCLGLQDDEILYSDRKKVNAGGPGGSAQCHLGVHLPRPALEAKRGKALSPGCTAQQGVLFTQGQLSFPEACGCW
ncbi:alpha-1-acid glycoprotein-like [Dasypus novemcinctus]|uniref:alpha-1-acid glycoprotein-like n=1 Tax=Dasypus novemcinctus TaxID=9361 RepID=UPI0039C98C9E